MKMQEKVLRIISIVILAIFTATLITITILENRPHIGEILYQGSREEEASAYLDGEAAERGEVYPMPKTIVYRSTSLFDYAVLRVTVLPEYAENKKVDFTAAFKDSGSQWASGKNINDYFRYEQTEEGSTEVKVWCVNPFGEQIIFTAISRNNPEITTSCTIDYAQTIKGVHFGLVGESGTQIPLSSSSNSPALFYATIDVGRETGGTGGVISLTYQTDEVYTIPLGEITESVTFNGGFISINSNASAGYTSLEMKSILNALGKELRFDNSIFKNYAGTSFNVMSGQNESWYYDGKDMKAMYDDIYGGEVNRKYHAALWNVAVEIAGESFTYKGYAKIIWGACDVSVSSLAFDRSQVDLTLADPNPFA